MKEIVKLIDGFIRDLNMFRTTVQLYIQYLDGISIPNRKGMEDIKADIEQLKQFMIDLTGKMFQTMQEYSRLAAFYEHVEEVQKNLGGGEEK